MTITTRNVLSILAVASSAVFASAGQAQNASPPSPAAKGGLIRVGIVHRSAPETRALLHDDLTEIYLIRPVTLSPRSAAMSRMLVPAMS